jgi:predicted acylesterase/phospholipase RssA
MRAADEDTNAELIRPDEPPLTALVFSGGLGLGAYHGGAFEAFTSLSLPIGWVAGSSAGAISAALIAGSAAADRITNLRNYWRAPEGLAVTPNASRHLFGWMNTINTHLFGSAGPPERWRSARHDLRHEPRKRRRRPVRFRVRADLAMAVSR